MWCLHVTSNFWRKIRCLPDDVVPRGEQDTREKKETVAVEGTGTGARMSTRAGMGARTGAGTGTRIEIVVEGRESLGTFEVVIEVIEVG